MGNPQNLARITFKLPGALLVRIRRERNIGPKVYCRDRIMADLENAGRRGEL